MCRKRTQPLVETVSFISRGSKIRTHNKGFGDPRVTITPCPYVLRTNELYRKTAMMSIVLFFKFPPNIATWLQLRMDAVEPLRPCLRQGHLPFQGRQSCECFPKASPERGALGIIVPVDSLPCFRDCANQGEVSGKAKRRGFE